MSGAVNVCALKYALYRTDEVNNSTACKNVWGSVVVLIPPLFKGKMSAFVLSLWNTWGWCDWVCGTFLWAAAGLWAAGTAHVAAAVLRATLAAADAQQHDEEEGPDDDEQHR